MTQLDNTDRAATIMIRTNELIGTDPRQSLTLGNTGIADVAGLVAKREVRSAKQFSQLWNATQSDKFLSNRPHIGHDIIAAVSFQWNQRAIQCVFILIDPDYEAD